MIDTRHQKKLPSLNEFNNLEDKFNAVVDFLSMDRVILKIPDMDAFTDMPITDHVFYVADIIGPQTSYIKTSVNEWLDIFPGLLDGFLVSEVDFDEITDCLQRIQKKCVRLHEKLSVDNDLKFEESFRYYTNYKNGLVNIPYVHLDLRTVYDELVRHFKLRASFFFELAAIFEEKLQWHLAPLQNENLSEWVSEHAKLEIAEFLESLLLTHRLKIKEGSSTAKFYREFYKLFGIPNSQHHQKVQQIRKRIGQPSYLRDLADAIETEIVKIKSTTK